MLMLNEQMKTAIADINRAHSNYQRKENEMLGTKKTKAGQ